MSKNEKSKILLENTFLKKFSKNKIQKILNIYCIILYNGYYIIYSISCLSDINFPDILRILIFKYIF
jgi:hypothetical protein